MAGQEAQAAQWEVTSSYGALPPIRSVTWERSRGQVVRVFRAAVAEGHEGAPRALERALALHEDEEAEFDLVMAGTLVTVRLRRVR